MKGYPERWFWSRWGAAMMNRCFYLRMAAANMIKSKRLYIPFGLAMTGAVMMFYILHSISQNAHLGEMLGGVQMQSILTLGIVIVGMFSAIFGFYTNNFLMKQRKKELGLYNILGMGKAHISKVLLFETALLYIGCTAAGLVLGVLLSKLLFTVLLKLGGIAIPLRFAVEGSSLVFTALLFCAVFSLMLLFNLGQIRLANPIELLRSKETGEREPKTKWLMALAGAGCMSAGYYLALSIESPLAALMWFFAAVILVIIGTYLLFTTGSIMLLKLLRSNKNYYYKTRHFVGVSSMIHRMKQNAVGLANICILSAMVLVLLSTTICLYMGQDKVAEGRYPREIQIFARAVDETTEGELFDLVQKNQKDGISKISNLVSFDYYQYDTVQNGMEFSGEKGDVNCELLFLTVQDYNEAQGSSYALEPGEALIAGKEPYAGDRFSIFGKDFRVKKEQGEFAFSEAVGIGIYKSYCVVLPDRADLEAIISEVKERLGYSGAASAYMGFDLLASEGESKGLIDSIGNGLEELSAHAYMDTIWDFQRSSLSLYGGLLFIGVFLGVLFLMATVMIIYYKQVSEGHEDRERFQIMQKVGMGVREVKRTIHSQVMTVFFLPLLVAVIHVLAAFPMITKLLSLFYMTDVALFFRCTLMTVIAFAAIYCFVYAMTARTYYKIVR